MTSLSRRIAWRIEALAYDALSLILGLIPFKILSYFGGALFKLIGPLTSKHHIARTNIKIAFPDLSDRDSRALLKKQWENCGRIFAEFPALHRLKTFGPHSRITVDGLDKLKDNAPAIIVTGHFANWEVMATVLTQSGLPVRITYRQINNPYIDARVRRQREAYGTQLLVQKSGARGARQLIDAIHDGQSVALLNDQKFNEGLSLAFFGEPAMTATGAIRLAIKTNRPLMPLSLTRKGSRFHMTIHDPIWPENTGDRSSDTENGVLKINHFIESVIRAQPAQWFWVHRRWPKSLYKHDES